MRCNLHTHTSWCDGRLTPEETVQAGIAAGLSHLGVTDHFDTEKLRPLSGITVDAMGVYVAEVRNLADRYKEQIVVLAGIEVDFCRERTDLSLFSTPERAADLFSGLDYVLFEYVNDPSYGGESLDRLFEIRRGIPLPVGLAHPDILMTFRGLIPRAAAGVLAQNDTFLELCPSPRNAVLAPVVGPDAERIEDEIFRVDGELHRAERRLDKRPDDQTLRESVAKLERTLRQLHGLCERMPSYRVRHHFVDEFFTAVGEQSVLLSIGTDSHAGADEVAAVDDAVLFIEDHGLSGNMITAHRWQGECDG